MKFELKPHREKAKANQPKQKLFLQLSFFPEKEDAFYKRDMSIVFIIDVSGSMSSDVSDLHKNQLEVVQEGLQRIAAMNLLESKDQVGLVAFDSLAQTLLDLNSFLPETFLNSVSRLSIGGGTKLGLGMSEAMRSLKNADVQKTRKMIIFTDGQTSDEKDCLNIAEQASQQGIEIIAFGVGDSYNERLLMEISEKTKRNSFHLADLSLFSNLLRDEFKASKKETISNAEISFELSKGFEMEKANRIFPSYLPLKIANQRINIGNLFCDRENTFVLEIALPTRVASKVRVAKASIEYSIITEVGTQKKKEEAEIIISYSEEGVENFPIDQGVMHYVQQLNLQKLVEEAAGKAQEGKNKEAVEVLDLAGKAAISGGNLEIKATIEKAKKEIQNTSNISAETRKTLIVNAKTNTKSFQGSELSLSDEEIRKMTGV